MHFTVLLATLQWEYNVGLVHTEVCAARCMLVGGACSRPLRTIIPVSQVDACAALLICLCRKEPVGPIEFLRQHNLTVLTKKAAFEPHFHFAFTDPRHDIDASKDFAGFSTLEQRLSHIAYHVLHGPCQQGAEAGTSSSSSSSSDNVQEGQQQQQQQGVSEGLVLDVGAGFGWYSLMAGMLGCR